MSILGDPNGRFLLDPYDVRNRFEDELLPSTLWGGAHVEGSRVVVDIYSDCCELTVIQVRNSLEKALEEKGLVVEFELLEFRRLTLSEARSGKR